MWGVLLVLKADTQVVGAVFGFYLGDFPLREILSVDGAIRQYSTS